MGGLRIKTEERVVAGKFMAPGLGGRIHRAEISQQLPEFCSCKPLKAANKVRASKLANKHSLHHLTPCAIHGGEGRQAHYSPGPGMLANGGGAKPNVRPSQCMHAWQAGSNGSQNSFRHRASPEVMHTVRGNSATCAEVIAMKARCRGQCIVKEPPKNFFKVIIPSQAPELIKEGWQTRHGKLHSRLGCRRGTVQCSPTE